MRRTKILIAILVVVLIIILLKGCKMPTTEYEITYSDGTTVTMELTSPTFTNGNVYESSCSGNKIIASGVTSIRKIPVTRSRD